eukprot:571682-Pelagomonas_calceolata.AAC.1
MRKVKLQPSACYKGSFAGSALHVELPAKERKQKEVKVEWDPPIYGKGYVAVSACRVGSAEANKVPITTASLSMKQETKRRTTRLGCNVLAIGFSLQPGLTAWVCQPNRTNPKLWK